MEEINVEYDPTGFTSSEEIEKQLEEESIKQDKINEAQAQAVQKEEEFEQEQVDPRTTNDQWGLKAFAKEGQSILTGGIQDTISSSTTFAERTFDAVTGRMQKEKEQQGYYRPDWDPFVDEDDPIITKTWWGKLLRGTVHFGSMAAGIVLSAKGLAAAGVPLLGVASAKMLGLGSVTRAMAIGSVSDLISKESDGHNALGALTKQYGWMDTPLTTKDTDHPMMMKFKNIVEGMGIGLIFDGAAQLIGGGSSAVKRQIIQRNASIENQTTTAALAQIRKGDAQFRAEKNAPIAQRHQGAHTSEVDVGQARDQLKRTRTDWGSEDGSTGGVTTNVERERIALEGGTTDEVVERTLRGLMSDEKFKKEMEFVKVDRKALADVWRDAVHSYREIIEGRNAAEMPAEEFLSDLFEKQKASIPLGDETFETWSA